MKKFFLLGKYKLFKLNRSITGSGLKKTLNIIGASFKNLKIKIQSLKNGKIIEEDYKKNSVNLFFLKK